jgi:predicted transposase
LCEDGSNTGHVTGVIKRVGTRFLSGLLASLAEAGGSALLHAETRMEVRRTVPVKLDVTDSDADFLHDTISEFLWAANYVVDHAWQSEYKTTSKAELQRETYDDVRAKTRL